MRTRIGYNPERFVIAAEGFAQEHKNCALFKNPRKARAALQLSRLCRLMESPKRRVRAGAA